MSVLDTFWLLFKADTSQARKDTDELDKKIDNLAAKGSKRSSQEEKDLKELRKVRQASLQDLKDQEKVAGDLSTTLLELGIGSVAAFATFEGLKNGIGHAIDYNQQLYRSSELTNMNARGLAAWEDTWKGITGNSGEFTSFITAFAKSSQEAGKSTEETLQDILNLANRVKEIKDTQGVTAAQNFLAPIVASQGLPADSYLILERGGEAIKKNVDEYERLRGITPQGIKDAEALGEAWNKTSVAIAGSWNRLNNIFSGPLTKFLGLFNKVETSGPLPVGVPFFGPVNAIAYGIKGLEALHKGAVSSGSVDTSDGIRINAPAPPMLKRGDIPDPPTPDIIAAGLAHMDAASKFNPVNLSSLQPPTGNAVNIGELHVHTNADNPQGMANDVYYEINKLGAKSGDPIAR